MSKKIKIIGAVIAVILLMATGWYWYGLQNDKVIKTEDLVADPFAGVSAPSGLDAATTAVYEEKIKLTKEMHAKMPDIWETWVAIGNLHSLLGDQAKALAAYQQAVNLEPFNIVAERNIAAVYAEEYQDYPRAVAHYRAAIRNEVNNAELYARLVGIQWKKLNDLTAAEADLKDGLNRTRNNYSLVRLAVEFYTETNQPDKAKEYSDLLKTLKIPTQPESAVLGIPGQ